MPIFDFKKHATVDSIDLVPEAARPVYVQKEGKFVLNEALVPLLDAYAGESAALVTARKDLASANSESASRRVTGKAVADLLREHGVDQIDEENPVNTVKAFVADLIEKGKKGGEVNVNMDKVRADAERRIGEVQKTADTKVGKMKTALEKHLISQAATAALAKAGGNIDLLLDKVTKVAKVVEDGDNYVVRIVDDAGEARTNGAGGFMDFDGYVSDMKTKPAFQPAFKSEVNSGTGARPGAASRDSKVTTTTGEKTSTQKIASGITALQAKGGHVSQ